MRLNSRMCVVAHQRSGFTLVELLVVVGIILTVLGLMAPAFNAMTASKGVETAVSEITGALEKARSYAMANNTYTWVGFYEEDADESTATVEEPPYTGVGRVVVAVVASKDGTEILGRSDSSEILPAIRLVQLGKVLKVLNVHLADVGEPAGGRAGTLSGRSDLPYTFGYVDRQNRIASAHREKTKFPFVAQGYTFFKTVRFNPRGEANINSTYSLRRVAEIGLVPTRGTIVAPANFNVAAIQFTGIAGNVESYRP